MTAYIKKAATATVIAGLAIDSGVIANAQSQPTAETHAQSDFAVQIAVAKASKSWKDAFNAGDAEGAAALYEKDAVMVVKPFGTFKGRDAIRAFWKDIVAKGFDDVVYSNTKTEVLSGNTARVSASWRMNKAHGVITNELWVVQEDGRALLREDHFEIAK